MPIPGSGPVARGAALLLTLQSGAAAAAAPAAASALVSRIDAATSLLVIAPHPDDETLCCAGVIQRVTQAGGHASVVWITSGDASLLDLLLIERGPLGSTAKLRDLGARRMREARRAATLLGVPATGQLFLGYPDQGVAALLTGHRSAPYTSWYTGAAAVPYAEAMFPGHPYTGESLQRDLAAVLERVQPNLILAPSPRDTHPDHRAAGLLSVAATARLAPTVSVRYWVVHGGDGWPEPRAPLPGVPLTAPAVSRGLSLSVFALTPAEEDGKLAALRSYATQLRTIAPFLLAFVRSTELYAATPGLEPP